MPASNPVPVDLNTAFPATGDSGSLALANYLGKYLVLYFYPKDNTPGCTLEGQVFRDNYAKFKALNADIAGVSRDNLKAHENFKRKQAFPFELISDTDETLSKAFDVIKMKNLYGKQVRGIERSTFLIDPTGKLVKSWRKAKVNGHCEDVLKTIEALLTKG